jgi:hypothetical protein
LLRPESLDLIRVTAEDLRYLDSRGDSLDESAVRRDSVVLRRLLVEGDLFRAWKAAGLAEKPRVVAPRLEYYLDHKANRRKINLGLAGGGQYFGVQAALGIINEGTEPVELDGDINPLEFSFTLSAFTRAASIYAEGVAVSRAEVILYVANKLGGAHLSSRRRGSHAKAFSVLDRNMARFNFEGVSGLNGMNAVYFELLSIGQLLGKSTDAQRLFGVLDN